MFQHILPNYQNLTKIDNIFFPIICEVKELYFAENFYKFHQDTRKGRIICRSDTAQKKHILGGGDTTDTFLMGLRLNGNFRIHMVGWMDGYGWVVYFMKYFNFLAPSCKLGLARFSV